MISPRKSSRFFTLTEIMVAIAILLIMMGFLFRFVISAQRIFSASVSSNYHTEQAQAIYDLLSEDMKRIVVSEENSIKDDYTLYLICKDAGNDRLLVFFQISEQTGMLDSSISKYGKIAAVVYWYNRNADTVSGHDAKGETLYRFDAVVKPALLTSSVYQQIRNATLDEDSVVSIVNQLIAGNAPGAAVNISDDYIVAEHVTAFEVEAAGIESGMTKLPPFLKVTMTVDIPYDLRANRAADEQTERRFSKIVFLNGAQ